MSAKDLSGFPTGWFVVCFASELAKLAVKPLKYFGHDLVAFRSASGEVSILDAFCPHLGAHLGYGGVVEEGGVRCPFHAWRFGSDGVCAHIPYAKKIPPGARIRSWQVREINGLVLLHHDRAARAPEFEIPVIPEYGTEEWLPWSTGFYRVKTHPREIVDNLADKAHFPAVHRTEIDAFDFGVDGHLAWQKVKGRALLAGGGVDQFSSTTTYHGPGYLLMRMDGALQNYMLVAHTPIDEGTLDLRLAVTLKVVGNRARTEAYVNGYMQNLKAGFEDDLRIWEQKTYVDPPLLCDGDGPIGRLRKWYRQFYADPSASTSASPIEGEV